MIGSGRERPATVWIMLVLLTLLSLAVAERGHLGRSAIVAMFAIAALKGELVTSRYMEIGNALSHWRVAYRAWLTIVSIALAAGHVAG